MTIRTALQMRLGRARQLVGGVQLCDGPGHFLVQSQAGARMYTVTAHVDPDTGWLMRAHCTCPDWAKMDRAMTWWIDSTGKSPHPGISHIDYSACCKHILAALLQIGAIE